MKNHAVRGLIVILFVCLIASFVTAVIAEAASEETFPLKLEIGFDSNVIFSRYNVKLKLDGKQIIVMQHGQAYKGTQNVAPGNHSIVFYKEDDSKVTGMTEVLVEGETSFSCTIHASNNRIDVSNVKVVSTPAGGQQKARTKPLDVLYLGSYDQDRDASNGKEPIEWYVLDKKDGKALLTTKYTIDNQKFNSVLTDTSWERSTIRKWLNSDFFNNAFSDEEKKIILTSTIDNTQVDKNVEWKMYDADPTEDKVFLLSYNEYFKYLQLDEERNPEATSYANVEGSNWWILLRSPGKNQKEVRYYSKGEAGSTAVDGSHGIRPAVWIDIQADRSNLQYELFRAALSYEEKDQYREAAEIYESLHGYNGSALRAKESRYQQAEQLHKSGDQPAAIEILEKLGDFKESKARILDYKYTYAIEFEEKGDYETAIKMFTEVGQYKQTMDHLRACFDKTHIQYNWLTRKLGDTKNAGHNTGYAKNDEIGKDDPHYGWSLGRFMMSGYTECKDDGPRLVFMKSPGDSVTLWFDLAQDIDKLNGDSGLRINRDTDGLDTAFQYPKSDFGRGALLVKHIDFRNSDSDVQMYSDYLAAKNGTGANTVIQINEEGIYEVALDYEMERKGLFSSYNDYRLYTTFEVKNASGMFFMFDVSTDSELQDYSRTADGFRIDLANSHSLSISYTRYAINQDETALDVRKTGLASDGDTFEKVGYYEITATNKETGEKLIKHIFVGRSADLKEYQALDDSLSKFSE